MVAPRITTEVIEKPRGETPIQRAKRTKTSVIMDVRLDQIVVDHSYQHELNIPKLNAIIAAPDITVVGTPILNWRDPKIAVFNAIDGMHRCFGFRDSANPPATLRCEVFVGLTVPEEAEKYDLLDKRSAHLPIDRYRSRRAYHHPEVVAMDAAVEAAGMTVSSNRSKTTIRCVGSVITVFRRFGGPHLTRTVRICHTAWPDSHDSTSYQVFEAIAQLIGREAKLDDERLIHVLSMTAPHVVISSGKVLAASMGSNQVQGCVQALYNLYDRNLRTTQRLRPIDPRESGGKRPVEFND